LRPFFWLSHFGPFWDQKWGPFWALFQTPFWVLCGQNDHIVHKPPHATLNGPNEASNLGPKWPKIAI
jgi:hypothetical protein